jgi:hypothetical protein
VKLKMTKNQDAIREKGFRKLILFALGCIPLIAYCASPPPASILVSQTPSPIPLTATWTTTTVGQPETPTLMPATWTPLPTYLPNERSGIIMNLYENPTCMLPCWWGITPGETNWRDAWQFLARFAANKAPHDTHFYESERSRGYKSFQVLLDVPIVPDQEYYPILNQLILSIRKDTNLVEYIDVNTGNVEPYTIPQILAAYGQPQQVYIHARQSQRPESNSITVYLYYPNYGFMSVHFATVGLDAAWKNDEITACFQKYTQLLLWPKGKALDMEEFLWAQYLFNRNSGRTPYQPIEDVSNLTTTKFFETFSGTSEQVCLNLITANLDK